MTKLNENLDKYPEKITDKWLTCVSAGMPHEKWLQTLGYPSWTYENCENFVLANLIRSCSISRLNGIDSNREHDEETSQLNRYSKQQSLI